jgi:hypothetical protein
MYAEQPLFTPPADDTTLWRYMDFEKFVSLLERRTLYFARLTRLADPFEGLPVRRHMEIARHSPPGLSEQETAKHKEEIEAYERSIEETRKVCFISCWHMNREESYAMWKIYAGAGAGIAIRSTFHRFKAALPATPLPHVLAGTVKYVDYDTHQPLREPYLEELAFSKRRCFDFESEFRGFVRDDETEAPGVEVPVDVNLLVEQVFVSPTSPAWIRKLVQAVLDRYGLKVAAIQSGILTGPSYF